MNHYLNQIRQDSNAGFGCAAIPASIPKRAAGNMHDPASINDFSDQNHQNISTRTDSIMKNENTKDPNKPPKTVRFAPTIKGIFVAYPQHEHSARWRTKEDEASTRAELRETVSIMRANQGSVPAYLQDANVATCRGLEHMASKRTLVKNSRAKSLAICAVLDEYDRQAEIIQCHQNKVYARQESLEAVATVSSCHTAHARSIAQLRGEADAACVQREAPGVRPSWMRIANALEITK